MRADLHQLLAERSIIHPTRIEAVNWNADELVLTVRGYRWWERPYSAREAGGVVRLIFTGLVEGNLRTDEFDFLDDEALEDFDVQPVTDVGWAQPNDWSIYCSGPIPDPLRVFARLHDFLSREAAFKTAEDFLNQANELSAFVGMTQTSGFMLASGPDCIRALLCAELERQGVRHNVLSTFADSGPNFLVRLGNSAFLCAGAEAEFESEP